ncbi:MAG: Na+/H+ antiporter subunit B [Planctomycetota bacterium]
MNSVILRTATRFMLPLLVLFSIVVLLRGHNLPGGGFVGGLLATSAFVLYGMAFGVDSVYRLLRIPLTGYIAAGLGLAIASGLPGLLGGEPFLYGQWTSVTLGGIGELKIGTPLFFDIGVYLTVLGVCLMMLLTLAEES